MPYQADGAGGAKPKDTASPSGLTDWEFWNYGIMELGVTAVLRLEQFHFDQDRTEFGEQFLGFFDALDGVGIMKIAC